MRGRSPIRTSWRAAGFTIVEVLFVVALVGLLLGIAVPNVLKARQASIRNECLQNLGYVEAAKEQFATENRKPNGYYSSEAEIKHYLRDQKMLRCPTGVGYRLDPIGTRAYCSRHQMRAPIP